LGRTEIAPLVKSKGCGITTSEESAIKTSEESREVRQVVVEENFIQIHRE